MTEIRWHGRGGLGAFTAARLLGCAVSLYEGKYALAFPSFGPERRGAPVFAFTRIDNKPITDRSEVVECDIAIVLDDTLFGDPVRNGLKPGATVIVNTTRDKAEFAIEGCNVVAVDATGLALEAGVKGKNLTEWQYGLASTRPRWNVSGTYMQVLPRVYSAEPDGSDPREFLMVKN